MTAAAPGRKMRSSPQRSPSKAQGPPLNLFSSTHQEITMFRQLFATMLAVFALNAFAAVDANQASRADLETVKGIGPGLSAKILKAREAGSFKNWNDLVDRVGGIGTGNASKLSQAGLTVGGAAYDSTPAAAPAAKTAKAPKDPAAKEAKKAKKAADSAGSA
jgi:competence protein ComEA